MSSINNSVQLIGRLGVDPELKTLDSGKKLVSFSMATNETYYNSAGEKVTDTQWHNIVAWDKKAETISEYLKKGSEVLVQGKMVNRQYEKDGATRHTIEVNLSDFRFLDKKKE